MTEQRGKQLMNNDPNERPSALESEEVRFSKQWGLPKTKRLTPGVHSGKLT